MTKTILFSDGTTQQMTIEEALVKFKPMVIKEMRKANNKFIFNAVNEEDFKQILDIELWKAFEAYDYTTGNCFTTYLYYKLQKGKRDATYSRYALKNQGTSVSMNAPIGDDDLKLEDMFASDDSSMNAIDAKELTAIILSNTSFEEVELLQIIMDVHNNSVQEYATKYNITRQAANQRVLKLKKKLQSIIKKQYLEIV